MSQIMRLRRIAGDDHHIVDRNNGERHESAFVTLVQATAACCEAELLPRSHGGDSFFGKFAPKAGRGAARLAARDRPGPAAPQGHARQGALPPQRPPQGRQGEIKRIFEKVDDRGERCELNLYIRGYDEDLDGAETPSASVAAGARRGRPPRRGQPGMTPEEPDR